MKKSLFGFERVKVIAVSVLDAARARRFYGETLALEPAYEGKEQVGFYIGDTILMLKENFYAPPSELPNPRVTLAVEHAPDTGKALRGCGAVISDEVQAYDDGFYIGSFLDSEGNKFWFCSPVKERFLIGIYLTLHGTIFTSVPLLILWARTGFFSAPSLIS